MEPAWASDFHARWAWIPAGKIRSVPGPGWGVEVYRSCLENLCGVRWGPTTAWLLAEAVFAAGGDAGQVCTSHGRNGTGMFAGDLKMTDNSNI
jgi:hypothetical protein